ncbi:MAG: polysaccharide biosynthesis C-terminal domain-containing protein [Chloroflexota bacterium]
MTFVQTIVLGVLPFFLYRYLLDILGAELLGLWSLILSSTSVSRIGELGLSASAIKFVSKYSALDDSDKVSQVIQTAFISVGLFIGLLLVTIYPIATWAMGYFVPENQLDTANAILPIAFSSLFITVVAGTIQSGLDGSQRIDLRALILIVGSIVNFVGAVLLAPRWGIHGVAFAQMIQAFTILGMTWLFLRQVLPSLPLLPYQWRKAVMMEMLGYGVNFQIASACKFLYKPMTMALLSRFGGLEIVAFYELAERLVRQIRLLIVNASRVLVPYVANLQEKTPERIQNLYVESFQVVLYISVPIYASVIAFSPIISNLWLGYYEPQFIFCAICLSVGWFFNTLNVPAYMFYLGIGELKWNTISHVLIAIMNLIFSLILVQFLGSYGIVAGWVIALSFGSLLIIFTYHSDFKVSYSQIRFQENAMVILASLFGIGAALQWYRQTVDSYSMLLITCTTVMMFALIAIIPMWLHPVRPRIMRWITQ